MGRDDDGGATVCGEAGQDLDDLGAGAGVEVAGRLVREDHPGLDGERACDRDALLLASREM